jgi:hypothetical protein
MSSNNLTFKGVLIDRSVQEPEAILKLCKVENTEEIQVKRQSQLRHVTAYSIVVEERNLWPILKLVAESLKSPGWHFHLVNEHRLYLVMPKAILIASNRETELNIIKKYAKCHGLKPDELKLSELFNSPFITF